MQAVYTETTSPEDNCESRYEITGEVIDQLLDGGIKFCLQGSYKCLDPGSPEGTGPEIFSDPVELTPYLPPIQCPGAQNSGGQGTFTQVVDVGEGFGSFSFSATSYSIPDRFVISGAATLDTGSFSGTRNYTVTKTSADRYVFVTVFAPLSGTAWIYSVGCTS